MTACDVCHLPPADESRPATLGPGESCGCGLRHGDGLDRLVNALSDCTGMTDAEIDEELRRLGYDPDAAVAPILDTVKRAMEVQP